MEYGLFVSEVRELPADPRAACGQWLHLLPPAPLRALYFGSEFCADLLPEPAQAERLCLWAAKEGVEAVLLTPMLHGGALERAERLLQSLDSRGLAPAVLFNDFGLLGLLRHRYPKFRRRAGRLLNRGLRDPRLSQQTAAGDAGSGEAPGRLRSLLAGYGVEAVETDPDLEGRYLGEDSAGMQRVLHFPYTAAATGRNCLIKADGASSGEACFTKGLALPCAGLCRGRCHPVVRPDSAAPLWRAGNTLFYQVSETGAAAQLAQADRVVLYERPAA